MRQKRLAAVDAPHRLTPVPAPAGVTDRRRRWKIFVNLFVKIFHRHLRNRTSRS